MRKLTPEDCAAGWTQAALDRYHTLRQELLAARYAERERIRAHHVALIGSANHAAWEQLNYDAFNPDRLWDDTNLPNAAR